MKKDTAAHFSRQAKAYAESETHAHGEDLEVLFRLAGPMKEHRCLDIATGPGHTAFRFAPSVRFVVATDLAPGMIRQARRLALERRIENVFFSMADAESLPFASTGFDLVTCRIAPHHFHDVRRALKEVSRVLRPGGRFAVEDSIAPEDEEAARFLHRVEVERDSTHVKTLSGDEWIQGLAEAGLQVLQSTIHLKPRPFTFWCERAGLSPEATAALERRILEAPEPVRSRFAIVQNGRVQQFQDEKILLVAER